MDSSNVAGVTTAWRHGGYTIAIVIPAAVRDALNISDGDRFVVGIEDGSKIVYEKITTGKR